MSKLMVGTQQAREECKAFKERLRFIAVSILSWSYFISKHLFTRYKFIPTHLSISINDPTFQNQEPQVNNSSSSIIM